MTFSGDFMVIYPDCGKSSPNKDMVNDGENNG